MPQYLDYAGLQTYYQLFQEYNNWCPNAVIGSNGVIDLELAKLFTLTPLDDIELSLLHGPKHAISDIFIKVIDGGKHNVSWPQGIIWGYNQKEPELARYGYDIIRLSTMDNGTTWIAKNLVHKDFFSDEWPEITESTTFNLSSAYKFYYDASNVSDATPVTITGTPTKEYFWIRVKNGGSKIVWPNNVEWESGETPTLRTEGDDAILFQRSSDGTKWIAKWEYKFINQTMHIAEGNTELDDWQEDYIGNYGHEYGIDAYLGIANGWSGSTEYMGEYEEIFNIDVESNKTYHVGNINNMIYSWVWPYFDEHFSSDGIFFWVEYKDDNGDDQIYSFAGNLVPQCWDSEYQTWHAIIDQLINGESRIQHDDLANDQMPRYVNVNYRDLLEEGSSVKYYLNYKVRKQSGHVIYTPYSEKNLYFIITHEANNIYTINFHWRCIEDA